MYSLGDNQSSINFGAMQILIFGSIWKITLPLSPLHFTMRSLRSRKSKIAYPMSKARAVPLGPFFPHCYISTATSTTLFHLGLPITAHLHWIVLLLHPPLSSKHPSSIPTPQVSTSWIPLCWKIERVLECPSRKTLKHVILSISFI